MATTEQIEAVVADAEPGSHLRAILEDGEEIEVEVADGELRARGSGAVLALQKVEELMADASSPDPAE